MKIFGYLLACLVLTGCQTIESRLDNLPTIDFEPELVRTSSSFVDDKVLFQVASAGTEAWIVVKNGTRNFLEVSSLNLSGSRCTYASRNTIYVPPGAVTTYRIPTLGLLGLCFNNEDQSHFINETFNGITYKKVNSEFLKLYFTVSYDSPRLQTAEPISLSQTLFLNFV